MIIVYLVLLSAFLLVAFVYLKTRNVSLTKPDISFFKERIKNISTLPACQQILEFDKLLDLALAKIGKKGTLGEKLKNSEKLFSNIDNVWKVHKIRNKIAHEVGFVLKEKEFENFRKIYLDAFFDLKIK